MKTTHFNSHARATLIAALALASLSIGANRVSAQTVPLIAGGLVVSIYGDANTPETMTGTQSTTYLDGNATPISLEEFSPVIVSGIDNPVLGLASPALVDESLPDSVSGANAGVVGEFGSSSEGTIQVSGNNQDLTIGGYSAGPALAGVGAYSSTAPGTIDSGEYIDKSVSGNSKSIALAQSTDTNVPRVESVINIATGQADTSTVLNDVYNTNNPRSVYSPDGSGLIISGQGAGIGDQGGLYSTTVGTNTTSPSSTPPGNNGPAPTPLFNTVSTRTVTEFNLNAATGVNSGANLYYSADQNSASKGTLTGIFENPTTTSAGTLIVPATATVNNATVNLSPEGFFFANSTTLYVADTGSPKAGGTADGGIQKWSYVGANLPWKLDYTLTYQFPTTPASGGTVLSETGFASLAGEVVGNTVDLYATSYTSSDAAPDGLYALQDTLNATSAGNEAIVELAASAPDSDFKGVALLPGAFTATVPEPSTWGLAGLGSLLLLGLLRRRAATL